MGGRGWEGDTVTDAIEAVVQGQRRKSQKRKQWAGDEEEEEEEDEDEEDGEVEETEERLPDREENLGSLAARARAGTGRSWLTQDELQQFRG